jgi:hypothetical protein
METDVLDKLDHEIKPGDFVIYYANGLNLARVIEVVPRKHYSTWHDRKYYDNGKVRLGYISIRCNVDTDYKPKMLIREKVLNKPNDMVVIEPEKIPNRFMTLLDTVRPKYANSTGSRSQAQPEATADMDI